MKLNLSHWAWRRVRSLSWVGAVGAQLLATSPLSADTWTRTADMPGARAAHSAVWTGTEYIAWGGGIDGRFLNTGGRLVPGVNTWRWTTISNAPSPRWFQAAVWTGSEMLIWGGRASFFAAAHATLGGRYNPVTDRWAPLSTNGAPTPRSQCAAVWTGTELLVWGGVTDGGRELNDGARFDPARNLWRPMAPVALAPRMEPAFVWTGTELVIHGGMKFTDGQLSFADGARYRPETDSWTPLPAENGPGSRTGHTLVWTGSKVISWGGRNLPEYLTFNTGAAFDPIANAWSSLPTTDAPAPRMLHAAVWTGAEMLVWGGQADATGALLNNGGRWNPTNGAWRTMTATDAPSRRMFWRPDLGIWTGRQFVVAGGSDYPASLASTHLYDPSDDSFSTNCLPSPEGLAAWWPMDGDARDAISGTGLQTLGQPVFGPGRIEGAIGFDGVDDGLVATPAPALNLGSGLGFTIETWVNPAHVTMQPLVEWADGTHFWLGVYGSGSIFANLVDTNLVSHSWRSDTGMVLPNQWQHVAMSYDKRSGLLRFYLNGRKVTEHLLGTFEPGTTGSMAIAHRPGQEHFKGQLDELSFYRRVLEDAEIVALHGAGPGKCRAPVPPPPVTSFDLSAGFTLNSNPSGPWTYGRLPSLGGPLELLIQRRTFGAENGVPIGIWYNEPVHKPWVAKVLGPGTAVSTYFNAPAGTVYFGANPDSAIPDYGAIRFTVPADAGGVYRIETAVRAMYDGPRSTDADFHLVHNGVPIVQVLVAANSGATRSNLVQLAPGDRVDFAAGRGSGNPNTGLKIAATLTRLTNSPPPPPPPQPCLQPAPGLAAWWPAERNPNDLIGTNRGQLFGGATYGSGKVGRALDFPGETSGMRIPASPSLDVGSGPGFTIEGWIHPADLEHRSPLVEWNRGGNGVVEWGVHLYILMPQEFGLGAGNLVANLADASGTPRMVMAPGGTITANAWQHIALTYDRASGLARLYHQGRVAAEASLGSFTPETRPDLYLGRRPAGDAPVSYRGRMDEISLYRRALTAAEIAAIAAADAAGKCRAPGDLDDLDALVASLPPPAEIQPLMASLEGVRASLERGNVRSALQQLAAFQNKVRAQLGSTLPASSAQIIALAQFIIESLDPTGDRRNELQRLAQQPLRLDRIDRDGSRVRVTGSAPPGIGCCVQTTPDLMQWHHAGWAEEIDDGVFEWIGEETSVIEPARPSPSLRLFRLIEP